MKALDRKLVRDLWSLKTQVLSIALVIACGIGGFIGSFSTYSSLLRSRDDYYASARFPHVFANAKRAPLSLLERIRAVPGVAEVEARVVRDAQLSIPGVAPPMIARLIGTDFERLPGMNRLTLKSGRWPAGGARGEVVVNQRFLEARHLRLGDRLDVLLNGRLEHLTVVGTALSPEYIFATRGGGMPDDEWFAVLWTDARALAAAFNMEGAFNSVLARVESSAALGAVLDALDRILEPYGGFGAVGRDEQVSHKIITQEIGQQRCDKCESRRPVARQLRPVQRRAFLGHKLNRHELNSFSACCRGSGATGSRRATRIQDGASSGSADRCVSPA